MKSALFLAAAAASLLAADYAGEGDRWWAHIQFLADDALQGREVGSEGYRKAAEYVAGRMEAFGLKAVGSEGYLQQVKFETRQLVDEESSLALVRGGNVETVPRTEAGLGSRADAGTVEVPMVFVGYELRIPEAKYDELASLDLNGKIAVYVNAPGPVDAPGPLKSHAGSATERWTTLQAAGAIGVATIANPRAPAGSNPSAAGRGGRGPQKTFLLADPGLQEIRGQKVAVTITRAGGEKFFAGSGHTYEEILALARENKPLPKFPLAGTMRVTTTVKTETLQAPNVAGMLPGTDAHLKNEYVIMSAHLDHIGVGRAVNGDSINNGAMDDASGIASILEIARFMKESGARPKRSIVFLAVAAEEKGELWSRYFAMRPLVEKSAIVADINLDMFMPLFPLKFVEVQGLAESTLGDTIREAAAEFDVQVQG